MFNILLVCLASLMATSLYGNVGWPVLAVATTLYTNVVIIAASIFVEAFVYKIFLKNVSYYSAFLFSLASNIISALAGYTLMIFLFHFLRSQVQDLILHMIYSVGFWSSIIGALVVMYLTTVFIEFCIVKLIIKFTPEKLNLYSTKSLLPSVLVGNLLTYSLLIAIMLFKTDLIASIAQYSYASSKMLV